MENNDPKAIILMQSGAQLRTDETYDEITVSVAANEWNGWVEFTDKGQRKFVPHNRIELIAEQMQEEKMM